MQHSVIIPAYNEQSTIETAVLKTLTTLQALPGEFEIIVVDDGSTDKTARIVKTLQDKHIKLITLPHNQGKGAAIQKGVQEAKGNYIAFLDADLATHPEELKRAFSLLHDHDLAIASRRITGATIQKPQAWYRSLAGQVFNLILRTYLHLPYRDTQCGCKAFRYDAAKALFANLVSTGWAFDVDLLSQAQQKNLRITEFPITWNNGPTSRVKWSHAGDILKELRKIKHVTRNT
ncbi:glycosyltransferase family 2 protein [Patescibacteria group bacterium]|nr:glycosyltransferase family 2 protein [Patescibacteria group bacterium]MBP9710291.1 glycosyltransferase family 2 protein [Patescibacteria group bacterium]